MPYPDLSTSGLSARTPEILPTKYHEWPHDAAPTLVPPSKCPRAGWILARYATFRSQGKFLVNDQAFAGKNPPKYCDAS